MEVSAENRTMKLDMKIKFSVDNIVADSKIRVAVSDASRRSLTSD